MSDDNPTQACTLAIETSLEETSSADRGWGVLKSLNTIHDDCVLEGDEISFGRHPNSTFHFNDKNISGSHCVIRKEPSRNKSDPVIAFISDMSTNGTYINNVKIGKGNKQLLVNGQEITLFLSKVNQAEKISYIYKLIEKEDEDDGPQKKYLVGETLGSGNFATVKLAVDRKSGEKFAIKIIDKKKYQMNSGSRKDALMDEVNILRGLNHPNIIHIQEIFDTEKTLYLVLELVQGGELLNDIISNLYYPEEKARLLFKQIVNGVSYLHERGIAHRDLKPENILLRQKGEDLDPLQTDAIKLSDFGLSRMTNEGSMMTTMCGTPQYLAPEIIMGTSQGGYGKEVDCWSMGGILYVMLCGYPPFDESKNISIFEQIRSAIFEFPEDDWSAVSEEAKDLIKRLLNNNPAKRYTCKQILEHPWINPANKLQTLLQSEQNVQTSQSTQPSTLQKSGSVLGKRKSDDLTADIINKTEDENNTSSSSTTSTTSTISNHSIKKLKTNNHDEEDDLTDDDEDTKKDINMSLPKQYSSNSITSTSTTNGSFNSNNSSTTDRSNSFSNNNNSSNSNKSIFQLPPSPQQVTPTKQSHYPPSSPQKPSVISKPSPPSSPVLLSTTGATSTTSAPQSNPPATSTSVDHRPMCKYGSQCYRKNPSHFKEYRHPLPQTNNQ